MSPPDRPTSHRSTGEPADPTDVADLEADAGVPNRVPTAPVPAELGPLEDFPDDPTEDPEAARTAAAAWQARRP